MILDQTSLMNTVNTVNDMLLYGKTIPHDEKIETARWIISRLGLKGSYRGLPAPTQRDFELGVKVYTGEKMEAASARHIGGQEATRTAFILAGDHADILDAYHAATSWMRDHHEFEEYGTFCCGKCTLAYWRHFWVGDFAEKEAHLRKGLQSLSTRRTDDGKWSRFPFFYAIYTLLEIDLEQARSELRYAKPIMERYLKLTRQNLYSNRKAEICRQALKLIQ